MICYLGEEASNKFKLIKSMIISYIDSEESIKTDMFNVEDVSNRQNTTFLLIFVDTLGPCLSGRVLLTLQALLSQL